MLGIPVSSKVCYLHTELLNWGPFLFPVAFTGDLMVTELSSGLCHAYFPIELSEWGNNDKRGYVNCLAYCKGASIQGERIFKMSKGCSIRRKSWNWTEENLGWLVGNISSYGVELPLERNSETWLEWFQRTERRKVWGMNFHWHGTNYVTKEVFSSSPLVTDSVFNAKFMC